MTDKPDKCPYCGADQDKEGTLWFFFECDTTIGLEPSSSDYEKLEQSPKCKDRQISQLQTRLAKLEKVAEAAKHFANDFHGQSESAEHFKAKMNLRATLAALDSEEV